MRSFRVFQAADMDRLFWLSLLLAHPLVTAGMDTCYVYISQSDNIIWKKIGEEAVFNCTVISSCSVEFYWFKENVSLPLNMSTKYPGGASLQINSLKASDSGIYFCAAADHTGCCTPFVGEGATLVVRENAKIVMGRILSVSFVLLAVYSLAIVTLIFLKKHGWNMNVCKKTSKNDKKNANKKVQFQDVLKEMHKKRNMEKNNQTASRSSSEAEASSNDLQRSSDDIYQNV
ncbi:forkhead box protein H [Sarotherodon galilaeus]